MEASNTIDNVKEKIQDETGISPDQQRLMIGKLALTDGNQTLTLAGVKQDSTIQLIKGKKGKGKG